MNLLLDTSVIIDYLGRKEPFFEEAEKIMAAGFFGDAHLWMAGQSLNDAFYVLKKYQGPDKVQQAMGHMLEVVTPVVPAVTDYAKATRLRWDDFEDCLIALCAQRAEADYIVTRDVKGFGRSMTPVIAPADWLALMKEHAGIEYEATGL